MGSSEKFQLAIISFQEAHGLGGGSITGAPPDQDDDTEHEQCREHDEQLLTGIDLFLYCPIFFR